MKTFDISFQKLLKKTVLILMTLFILMGIVQWSCSNDDTFNQSNPPISNWPPKAIAGPDQQIFLPLNSTYLVGSSSTDQDNNIISHQWTKVSGPSTYIIINANAAQTQLTDLVDGNYVFELKVTDAAGLISKDSTKVNVLVNVTNNPSNLTCDSDSTNWTKLQNLPGNEFFFSPRFWFNGDNFLFGVNNEVFAVSNKGHLWKYWFSSNDWVMIGDFPENMYSAPVVFSLKGKAFFIGDGHCWQYDPITEQWSKKIDPPEDLVAPLISNNRVYLRNSQNQIVEFNPSTDSYTIKNSCPSTQGLIGWFFIDGSGYHVYNNKECWKYDPVTDSWQQKGNLNIPGVLHSTSSFILNSNGYIIGDYNAGTYNDNLPMKLLRYDPETDEWTNCPENDYTGWGAYNISTVSLNGVAYIGLGYNNGDFNATDFWRFQ